MKNKKELLKSPVREWSNTSRLYDQILLVPAGTKHDSGYMHMAIIGVTTEGKEKKFEICGYPDDVSWYFPTVRLSSDKEYAMVRTDCYYPQGIIQFHGGGKFWVSEALSSMDVKFIPDHK